MVGQDLSNPQTVIDLLEKMDLEIVEKSQAEQQARDELKRLDSELVAIEAENLRLQQVLEARRVQVRQRVRALYKYSGRGFLQAMLAGGGQAALLQRARYLLLVVRRDMKLLEIQKQDLARQTTLKQEAGTRRLALEEGAKLAEKELTALNLEREHKRGLLEQLQRQVSLRTRVEEEQTRSREALSTQVTTLGGTKTQLPPPPLVKSPSGFDAMRGKLPFPTSGKVTRTYGRYQLPGMMAPEFSKGLEITAPTGTPFKAVFDGKVQMADWFKGYGLMVIINHGGEYRSIYTHASRLLVKAGDEVETGDVIGLVGDTGSLKGPYLYLEIRQGKTPVNPMEWIVVPPDAMGGE